MNSWTLFGDAPTPIHPGFECDRFNRKTQVLKEGVRTCGTTWVQLWVLVVLCRQVKGHNNTHTHKASSLAPCCILFSSLLLLSFEEYILGCFFFFVSHTKPLNKNINKHARFPPHSCGVHSLYTSVNKDICFHLGRLQHARYNMNKFPFAHSMTHLWIIACITIRSAKKIMHHLFLFLVPTDLKSPIRHDE